MSEDYFVAIGFAHELMTAGITDVITLGTAEGLGYNRSQVPDCAVIDAADEHPETFAHVLGGQASELPGANDLQRASHAVVSTRYGSGRCRCSDPRAGT